MKKIGYLLLLIIGVFITFISVEAKDINDVMCDYDLYCKDPLYGAEVDVGYMRVVYYGYNNGNYADGTVELYYGENMQTLHKLTDDSVSDYKNWESIDKNKKMSFTAVVSYDKKKKTLKGDDFIFEFNKSKTCPVLQCNTNNDNTFIGFEAEVNDDKSNRYRQLNPTRAFYRENQYEGWLKSEDFFAGKAKEPLVCSYELQAEGYYTNSALQKTQSQKKCVDLELTTNYDSNNGQAIGYMITINNSTKQINTLDNDVSFSFKDREVAGEIAGAQEYPLNITSAQLKKIFAGKCLSKDSLFIYLNKNDIIAGEYNYYLTTDRNEVDENISEYDVVDDDDWNIDFGPDIRESEGTCKGELGAFAKDLSKILKAMRIIGPILVLVFSTVEYVIAVASKDAEGLKKANSRLIKRLILMIILFLLPILVDLFIQLTLGANYANCIE